MSLRARVLTLSQINGLQTVTITGTSARINIEVPGGGYYWYRLWLSDSATSAKQTTTLPTSGSTLVFEGVTDSAGKVAITFANTSASHTWYAWAIFCKANVSDAITAGV